MNKLLACCVALALSGSALGASAKEKASGGADADGVHRDPAGQKGISPYNEALAKGRKAFGGQDYDAAIAAFQEAIGIDAKAAMAHLLLAQVHMAKGDAPGAKQALSSARETRGTEAEQSKLLMVQANVDERSAEPSKDGKAAVTWNGAKESWSGYAAFVAGHSKAPDYRATATERNTKIDQRVKRVKDYEIVRKRIADNAKKRSK